MLLSKIFIGHCQTEGCRIEKCLSFWALIQYQLRLRSRLRVSLLRRD
jgi:hypothetical protein